MDYRDERDALRARIESLEGELATARAEVDRMRATEAALDTSKREIQRLRAEVERLRPTLRPRENRGLGLLIAGGLVAMIAAFGAAYALRASPATVEPTPIALTAIPPPPEPLPPPEPEPPPRPAEPPPRPVRPVKDRSAHAEWTATITRSQGSAPPPGTSCKVLAELAGDGSEAGVKEVEVACGAQILYRSTDRLNGMSSRASNATEEPGQAPGTLKHALVFQDVGARTGARAQISLDTAQRTGAIWSDSVPAFRVEVRVEPWSLERTGAPLIDPENRKERLTGPIVRTGTVLKVEGTPAASAGAACTVDVSPVSNGQHNCRVRVRCGGALLYGAGDSGYNQCVLQEGRVGRLEDERSDDGDPALDMDLSENTVIVRDDGDPAWMVTVRLTPQARR